MALEDGGRVDFGRLRNDRRDRLLAEMEAANLDALVLGRSADVHYASGARQLWRAGAHPYAPSCVVVRQTGSVHILSVWDEGLPPEIGRDQMFGLTFNPANLMAAIGAVPGLVEARRVGIDGLTPRFAQLLPSVLPTAELANGSSVLAVARRIKTPDEIVAMSVAAAIAEAALSALEEALEPGVTERALLGVYDHAVCTLGATNPPSESVAFATPRHGPVRFRYLATDRPVGDGELVVLAPGALCAGYEAGLARTRLAGRSAPPGTVQLADRCWRGMDALLAACRPGNTGADLYRAWEGAGENDSPVVLAHGLGLGAEPPVIGFGRGTGSLLEEGMVLSVQSWVSAEGTGGCLERAAVRIAGDGAELLTRSQRFEP
jgi:Xaa-Pro dipeptidase